MSKYYARLAHGLCKRANLYDQVEDVEQIARIALWQMSATWKPEQNDHFGKASFSTVRGAMIDYLRTCKGGYSRHRKTAPLHFSIDVPLRDDITFKEILEDPQESVDDILSRELPQNWALYLDERTSRMIRFYYFDALTLKEIGKIFDVDHSRVSQIKSRGLKHLRKRFQTSHGRTLKTGVRSLKYYEAKTKNSTSHS